MTAPARTAAYHALRAVTLDRSDLPAALQASRQHLVDERDRALTAEIVTGALRWQRSLDFLIEHFAKRHLEKLDIEVVTVLRLSLYQILHLDRVPVSAIVDDAVNLARAARKPSASGFVNAVLRSTLRARRALPLPARPVAGDDDHDGAVAYLGITHSHPDWLVRRWLARYGFDATERWVQFNNLAAPLTLRVNGLRATRETARQILSADGVDTEPARCAPDGLVVSSGNPLRRQPDGIVFVQDEASQLVSAVAATAPGEHVLDLCASPGGKTTAMAADMDDTGTIVASDVREKRVTLLQNTVRASGASRIQIVRIAGDASLPFLPVFDCVLVDAPCSGLGTLRRDPDLKWRRRESDLAPLARSQRALLQRAADVVRPGGRLVYATCSSEPDENDDVVEAFLHERTDFAQRDLGEHARPAVTPFVDARGRFRTLPHVHGLEAFFATVLVRS